MDISNLGTFTEKVNNTRQNLIRAINKVCNEGKLAMRAFDPVEETSYDNAPSNVLANKSIELYQDGSYPVIERVVATTIEGSTLVVEECLPLVTDEGRLGILKLDLGKCFMICKPVIEVRVCSFDESGNAGYSDRVFYNLQDPERLSAELISPLGRKATRRFDDDFTGGSITSEDLVIVDGGVGYSQSNDITFTILSESGSSAELSGVLDSKGSLTGITIVSGGTDYSPEDMILTNSPLSFDVGQTIIISARVNDPLGEMDRVEFYGNGVELNNVLQNQNIDDDLYQIQYTIPDQGLEFISVRALYGDGRDDGPSIPVGYSSKSLMNKTGVVRVIGVGVSIGTAALLT